MNTRRVLLGEIADTCLGKMLDQKKNKGEYQPYLANVNVRWGGFDLDDLPKMRFLESEEERYGLKYGDILVCEGGEPGRCAIWKNQIPNMKFQKALHRVRVHENKVDYRWLFYRFLFAKSRNEFDQYFSGTTTIKHMPGDKLVKIRLDLPELSVQRQIGETLSYYDDLIENNQRQIKLLEEAAQRLYKEWFVDLRFPGHEHVKIVDGVPNGWSIKMLQEIVDYHDSFRKPLSGKQRAAMQGTYRYYGAAGVLDYVNAYLFDGTYLLLGEDGTVVTTDGYPILQYVSGQFWVNNHAHVLTGKGTFTTEYIYMLFKHLKVTDVVTGVAQPKISQGRLSAKKVLVAGEKLVQKYHNLIQPILQKILILEEQVVELTEARDRLLPKLMSGEIEL